ncbi:hypothetical protein X769_24600 [Mesorhizobium sp. LSJC268A00]|uniref:hypothetical protein n=1 Tax=unclassified Mesorhizobium TaxID=325217 RepID=UPI0003CE5211|nr:MULTISPECIES: hypothetical protein [unclassified Mesorhizobium]ESW99308.1 hypothetical protein X769_24600 [Mesorhizobium sp. LSJC268A00]ESZ12901.1 hypothetical protein X735_21285 [Mesorhizobium sp. L2C085B000]ESZ49142.1 hypothetical protein X731_09930 [Mesorhizobium sp. L2C054A000]
MTGIEFLFNQANKVEGLAYAGFETFRGSPYTSCARETGQNSRDAPSGSGPVQVAFNLLEVDRSEIPFADQLAHSIDCCLDTPRDDKTRQHLERAKERISSQTIKVLEIADFNTTGLTGPVDDPNSVFAALVKGDGVTNKTDEASAGSYGIGKNAAYAVSDLQTVIYSTRFTDPASGQTAFAAQGRLRLISHTDGDQKLSAEGYWGNPGFSAIESVDEAPAWVGREAIGTSIFSVGFREESDWAERMTLSLATNFFLAIDRGEIEFFVNNGAMTMNQSSLDSILDAPKIADVAETVGQSYELTRAKQLLRCARSEATVRHPVSVPGLGEFVLHLLVAEGLPREIHILRNGIYICDNFAKFGQPMRRFPSTREFIAILEPSKGNAGRKSSQLLKRIENPAHGAFEPERIVDGAEQALARKQIKELITNVREIIRAAAKLDDIDHSQIDELSHLFAAGASADPKSTDEAEKDPDRYRYGEARKGNRTKEPPVTGTGAGKRRQRTEEKATKTKGENTGDETRTPRGSGPTVPLTAVRSALVDGRDSRVRSVFFTAGANASAEIIVSASGLTDDVPLTLASADSGMIVDGKLRTSVKEGERVRVQIEFAEPYAGPIELTATSVTTARPVDGVA